MIMMKKRNGFFTMGLAAAMAALMGFNVMAAGQITESRAEEIALEHAGISKEQVAFSFVQKDYEDRVAVYDVEFMTDDYKEYDYEIRISDGKILSYDYDAEYTWDIQRKSQGTTSQITEEAAKAAALQQAGLKEADVKYMNVQKDYDDGRVVYEGKFFYGDMEYEFEVDGNSGKIIDWDAESIYD